MKVILSLLTAAVLGQTPAEVVGIVHADLAKLAPESRQRVRYLDLGTIPEKDRPKAVQVLRGHCNGLSRNADLVAPARVHPAVLRVTLDDYRWDPSVWDRFSESDPYYTVRAVTDWPGGVYSDGVSYPAGSFRVNKAYPAPWAGKEAAEVWTMTGSRAPVLRADWWFNQTAAQADRVIGYYDMLGVKDEAGFQLLIGADRKKAEAFRAELRDAVNQSGVTLHPRAIVRHDAGAGGYWRSLDFIVAKGEKNPLRVLGRDLEKVYDATEQFGLLPNNLWATGLFDRQGKRQDFAPPEIASDGQSKSNDKRVHVNASCIRCHVEGGLRPIPAWVRGEINAGPFALRTPDYAAAVLLRQQYARDLMGFMKRDRDTYEAAIKEATGLDSKGYAAAYGTFWESYEDGRIDLERAAASLGVDAKGLQEKLLEAAKANALDPVLSVLARKGGSVDVRQWEEVYPAAQSLMGWFRKAGE